MGDRNTNDKAKIKLLNILRENNINFTIIYSNHDAEFIKYLNNEEVEAFPVNMTNLLVDTESEFNNILHTCYKLFDYNKDLKILYSHAPMNTELFNNLVLNYTGYNITDDEEGKLNSSDKFSALIDKINEEFIKKAKDNTLSSDMLTYKAVWQRKGEWRNNDDGVASNDKYKNVIDVQVNGHDLHPSSDNHISLDNQNCKAKGHFTSENILVIRTKAEKEQNQLLCRMC